MLAFPSYNYEGYFKLEQVVELKSTYPKQTKKLGNQMI